MKNYFLLVDENVMNYFKALLPWMQFVEATGMNVKEFPDHTFLTTPVLKKEENEEVVELAEKIPHPLEGNQYLSE